MRMRRKHAAPPEGMRLVWPDGKVIVCDMLRDPDGDERGCAMWLAVPREPLPQAHGRFFIHADVMPGKTILQVRLPV